MAKSNEEKARELALEMGQEGSFMYSHAMSILTKMAEWKEQQIIDWVRKNAYIYIIPENDSEGNLCETFLEDAFIDDFRKAMKGE